MYFQSIRNIQHVRDIAFNIVVKSMCARDHVRIPVSDFWYSFYCSVYGWIGKVWKGLEWKRFRGHLTKTDDEKKAQPRKCVTPFYDFSFHLVHVHCT